MRSIQKKEPLKHGRPGLTGFGTLVSASVFLAMSVGASAAGNQAGQTSAAATAATSVLPEVTVTAQFRKSDLQATPVAITAINSKLMNERGQTSIFQVAQQAPNVTLKPNGAAFGPSLQASIRGIGQGDYSFALEPGVGMYVNDVYYGTIMGTIFDLLDLDRVEILRGPQGTLAGMNSIGGAVKLFSKKPNGQGGGYVSATYGSLNRMDFRAADDFTLVPDQLYMRIAGVTKHHDGYVTRLDYACTHPGSGLPTQVVGARHTCKLGTEGGQDVSAARTSLRWVPNQKLEINVVGDLTNDSSEVQASTQLAANTGPCLAAHSCYPTPLNGVPYDSRFVPKDPYVTYSTFTAPNNKYGAYSIPPVNTLFAWGLSGTADYTFNDNLSLKSISAYRYYRSHFAEDTDGSPLNRELVMNYVNHKQFSQELRLSGSLPSGLMDYTIGGFYFWERSVNANRVNDSYAFPGGLLDFLSNDPVVAHSKSGFAHVVFHVTDKLDLTGGIRYTSQYKKYSYVRTNPDGTFNPIVGPINDKVGIYSGNNWDYRANISYNWTNNIMTYAEFSTGFKGGGVNPRPFYPEQVQPFGPEKLDAYEVGAKSTLWDGRARLNLSAFYNDYKDIQLTLLTCPQYTPGGVGPCALPSNAGTAHIKGVEAETTIEPIDGLTFNGSLSYLDFKYVKLAPGVQGPGGISYGMVAPLTPSWKWSAGAQYVVQLGDKYGSLTPRVDASYQSGMYGNASNAASNLIHGYTTVNAHLTWKAPRDAWEATFEVTNLTDKLYYYSKFDLLNLAGFVNGQPAPGREWAITIKRNF